MNKTFKTKKGLDLNIVGAPQGDALSPHSITPARIAITPDDFTGLTLKPLSKEGDVVKCGQAILCDKHNPNIIITAPIDGTVTAIQRGERRHLEHVIIVPADNYNNVSYVAGDKTNAPVEIINTICNAGLWGYLRQRPYNIVPSTEVKPRDIFVSLCDTAPLVGDRSQIFASHIGCLNAAVKALNNLTDGDVYVGRRKGSAIPDLDNAIMVDVDGPHPAGNPGVIAANIKPVNKGETIWTLDGETLMRIGSLFSDGKVDWRTVVAVTGSEISHPQFVDTIIGADIASLLSGQITKQDHHIRIISGNLLSGIKVSLDSYLRFPFTQVTVIPEGDDRDEFMGWASLSPKKMSTSRSFPGHFLFKKLFKPDARLLGGRRAMIMSEQYDNVVPMDIMTEYLIKAIISKDIEKMEALGIYEVAPEDFAVAEYVCTSKMPIQAIISEGLEYMRKELE